ncbi:putative isomerase, Enoyl-CoA hydratase, 3-hydroxyacyl-CoA dehydrogenase [Helianthus annuus]|nr:putative isomerase, Enoyl-CoA hydratase, 3-hydroxyacyl-CoA dehydrogenase [Helianthus annuus]KAJ0797894.1 putative isomerase, Enoyl-CoA hydratase, 3-hydroxyacyl-CoA dehydrogenase [Helianthus annuus]
MLLKLYGPFLSAVLNSLKESFDQALQRDDVKAIVVTGAKGKFSGGFDLNVLGGLREGKGMDITLHCIAFCLCVNKNWKNGWLHRPKMVVFVWIGLSRKTKTLFVLFFKVVIVLNMFTKLINLAFGMDDLKVFYVLGIKIRLHATFDPFNQFDWFSLIQILKSR